MNNAGNAVLILGAIYLHYAYNLSLWVSVPLVLLGVLTWLVVRSKQTERYREAQIRYIEAKTRYLEVKTRREEVKR